MGPPDAARPAMTMEFRCRLGTPTGEVFEQVCVAESEARLRRDFEDKGMLVLAVRPAGVLAFTGLSSLTFGRSRRVPTRDFLVFNQELATLLKAGLPLLQCLDILRARVESPVFKAVLDDVYERVRSGSALSEALEAQGLFPGVYTASLMAGEKTGGLEEILRRYVAYMKMVGAVRRRTLSALIYPAVLTLLSLAVVALIVIRVVPEFASFYDTFDAELPLATRVILAISDVVRGQFVWIALGVALAGIAAWRWLSAPDRRALLDRWMLRVPFVGTTVRKFTTSQLSRTLGTLLSGGIPLVNALDITARSIGNRFVARELDQVAGRVREGEGLSSAMVERGVFPDIAVKMVEVGESTGALQDMLHSVADFYDEEIETTLGRFVTLIEPILLIVMGLVIAALLLALYLPVFQLSSVAGG